MIHILHGQDIAASRNQYLSLKNAQQSPLVFDGVSVTITDLMQIFEGGGLFDETKNIFIEELLSKRKSSKELDSILETLTKYGKNNTIVLWESKELSKKTVQSLKETTVQQFDFPKILFTFLESIKPRNAKQSVSLLHQLSKHTEIELIFFMMIKQMRMVLAVAHDGAIDEVKRLAPWQQQKLLSQSRQFDVKTLQQFYTRLYDIDLALKTGKLPVPLGSAIDFLLLGL